MTVSTEIIKLSDVDSTNEYVKRLYDKQTLKHGLVVIAEQQNKGKGQHGKLWESDKGENLLFTLFLKAKTERTKEEFSFAISVAVLELLKKFLPLEEVKVKWPNDLLVNGEKIAGILIENRLRGDSIEGSFVGVGLNVNQCLFPRFTRAACSLKSITGKETDACLLAQELRHLIVLNLKKSKKEVKDSYDKALYLYGQEAPFLHNGKQVLLTVLKVNDRGQLIVNDKHESQLGFDLGELKYLV